MVGEKGAVVLRSSPGGSVRSFSAGKKEIGARWQGSEGLLHPTIVHGEDAVLRARWSP